MGVVVPLPRVVPTGELLSSSGVYARGTLPIGPSGAIGTHRLSRREFGTSCRSLDALETVWVWVELQMGRWVLHQ